MLSLSVFSPNLSPTDYFAFPKLKMELKDNQYKNISEIPKPVTAKLKTIPIHEREKAIKRLKNRTKVCIRANGDYLNRTVFSMFLYYSGHF